MEVSKIQSHLSQISGLEKMNFSKPPKTQDTQATMAYSPQTQETQATIVDVKNINDRFGMLKKAQKAIQNALDTKTMSDELLGLQYKNEKVLYSMPFEQGSVDLGTDLENALKANDEESFFASAQKSLDSISQELQGVKKLMLKKAQAIGGDAQASIDRSPIDLSLSSIAKSTNIDHIKENIHRLLA